MIHHLILLGEEADFSTRSGKLISGTRSIAIQSLGSVQCFAASCRWSQTALEELSTQCPCVFSRWDGIEGDIRLFPMEETVWDSQIVISEVIANTQRVASLKEFVIVWD